MRRPALLPFLLVFCAALARAQNSPDFPQTQQSNQGYGGGSDFAPARSAAPQDANGGAMGGNAGDASPKRSRRNPAADLKRKSTRSSDAASGDAAKESGASGGETSDEPAESETKPSPMDLEGAKVNFAAIVETYVAKESPDGYWPYAEKKNGKAMKSWRLVRPSVAEPSVKHKTGGRYSALVKLRDARDGRPLTLEFVVDFSGANWKVVSAKPAARQ